MSITFDHPLWLSALLLVPAVVLLARRGSSAIPAGNLRWATILRAVGVGALALALAAPRLGAAGRDVDVAFLVDASDSVGGGVGQALAWIDDALGEKSDVDRAALALFGADARLEYTLRAEPPVGDVATIVDGSATDLARALRLGQGVLGSQNRRRVVLFTDGRQTQGDVVRAAAELAEAGVRVDVVPLAGSRSADVLIEEVRAPSRVRQDEAFDVVGVVRNTGEAPVDVVIITTRNGVEIDRRTVTASPGRNQVVVEELAAEGGAVRYEMRLASGASVVPANDVGRAAVQVDGPARILVYEGEDGAGGDLARALSASGLPTDRTSATQQAFPSLDLLLNYDSVVLVDVPATALGADGMVALDAFVRDAGRGVVAIGGDDAYGMGGYDGTPLEDLLPVFARVKDPKKRPSVAEALVVDVSGSMAACHCRPDGFGGGPGFSEEGGVNKTDISREAIARAVEALEAQDIVGVLAFNTQSEWVIPLQQLPPQAVVDEALGKLNPDGDTNVAQAVRAAIAGLKDVNARLRHIVLFTDGFSEDPDMIQVAREAAEAGITLSVVATGEGTGEVLRRMAQEGNGRYYPGRDLFSIPDIIVSEVQFAARPIINEGSFLPLVTGIAPATESLSATPPLFGYLATTAKPTARQLLQIGEERDPLLVQWQAGLGQAVAWTSDATSRWSRDWVSWDQYQSFWSDVVKDTLPGDPDPRFSLQAVAGADGIRITIESVSTLPGDVRGTAVVTLPDGTRREIDLQRTELGTWEGVVTGAEQGVYAVSGRLAAGETDVFRDAVTAIRSYSAEYAVQSAEPGLLERIAEAGEGRFDPEPASAFLPEDLDPGSSSRALWPLLALLALLTLPADVGLRRLRLERADWGRFRRWVGDLWGREPDAPSPERRTDATSGLFAARERARRPQPETPTPPSVEADADDDSAPPRTARPPRTAPATPVTGPPAPPPQALAGGATSPSARPRLPRVPEGPAAPGDPQEPAASGSGRTEGSSTAEPDADGAAGLLAARRRKREQD